MSTDRRAALLAFAIGAALACRPTPRAEELAAERATGVVRLEPQHRTAEMLDGDRHTRLRAFRADLPSRWSWRVRVPAGASLETQCSFAPDRLAELAGRSCEARIEADRRGGLVSLVTRRLEPKPGWQPLVADLRAFEGHSIELRLSVGCGPSDGASPLREIVQWAVPVISGPRANDGVNVLLVTVDTLRADHLRAYGYERETSPNLDRLARRGILFRNAETVQSATWPAVTSLHTSRYPSSHGVVWNGGEPKKPFPTLAQLLDAKGYSCSAFVSNMKRARHPGFARVFAAHGAQANGDRRAVETASRQLRAEAQRRFFVWLHLIGPHANYSPPPPHDAAFTRPGASSVAGSIPALNRIRAGKVPLRPEDVAHVVGLYDGEVAWVDSLIGRILGALRDAGHERTTVVVLTADHGEDLHEHHRYFFHSPSMYASSLRIPLIVSLPGVLPEGVVSEHPASIVDVAPTLLSLLGLPRLPSFQGVDLLPRRSLPAQPARTRLFSETHGRVFGVRSAEWRFIFNPERLQPDALGGPYPFEEAELYDQRSDPREQRNLAASRPDLVRAFSAEVMAWRRRDLNQAPPEQPRLDTDTQEELRALGYIE